MGILSECFAAHPDELVANRLRYGPSDAFQTVASGGLTPLDIATLFHITLGGAPNLAYEEIPDLEKVLEISMHGPWVVCLPEQLQRSLVRPAKDELRTWADRWAESEELTMGGIEPDACGDLLEQLSKLAREASADGRGVFMWNNL